MLQSNTPRGDIELASHPQRNGSHENDVRREFPGGGAAGRDSASSAAGSDDRSDAHSGSFSEGSGESSGSEFFVGDDAPAAVVARTTGYVDDHGCFVPYEDGYFDGQVEAAVVDADDDADEVPQLAGVRFVDWQGAPMDTEDDVTAYTLQERPKVRPVAPPRPPPMAVESTVPHGAPGAGAGGAGASDGHLWPEPEVPHNWAQLSDDQREAWAAELEEVRLHNVRVAQQSGLWSRYLDEAASQREQYRQLVESNDPHAQAAQQGDVRQHSQPKRKRRA